MRAKPRWRGLWLLLVLAGIAGCASGGRTPSFTPATADEANVVVYLSNQSSARRSVVLAVYVDGRLALREDLPSVDRPNAPHGYPEKFSLRLTPGPHTIKVVAEGQVAQRSTEVVVGASTLYVDAAYHWSPGSRREKQTPETVSLKVGTERPGFV